MSCITSVDGINQSIIPSTDVIQLTLTLKITTAQVVETSVTVNNNSPIRDYVHSGDQTQPTFENIKRPEILIFSQSNCETHCSVSAEYRIGFLRQNHLN